MASVPLSDSRPRNSRAERVIASYPGAVGEDGEQRVKPKTRVVTSPREHRLLGDRVPSKPARIKRS
jgi:hypothetical protein